eukprot:NODE_286_length_11757_cov_0.187768.p2 type:complete len:404 gc:universal NODE_286_length_11757_cov_0.187768:3859-5070(+)
MIILHISRPSHMRLRDKKSRFEVTQNESLQYVKLKSTNGSVLKTFSKRGKTNVGHLVNPPTRYKFDHTVKLDSIVEEGIENSPVDWNELKRKAQESRNLLMEHMNGSKLSVCKEKIDKVKGCVSRSNKRASKLFASKTNTKNKENDLNQSKDIKKLHRSNLIPLQDKSNILKMSDLTCTSPTPTEVHPIDNCILGSKCYEAASYLELHDSPPEYLKVLPFNLLLPDSKFASFVEISKVRPETPICDSVLDKADVHHIPQHKKPPPDVPSTQYNTIMLLDNLLQVEKSTTVKECKTPPNTKLLLNSGSSIDYGSSGDMDSPILLKMKSTINKLPSIINSAAKMSKKLKPINCSLIKFRKPKSRNGISYRTWKKDILLAAPPIYDCTNRKKCKIDLSHLIMVKYN